MMEVGRSLEQSGLSRSLGGFQVSSNLVRDRNGRNTSVFEVHAGNCHLSRRNGSILRVQVEAKTVADRSGSNLLDPNPDQEEIIVACRFPEFTAGTYAWPSDLGLGILPVHRVSQASHEGMFRSLHITVKIGEVHDPGKIGLMELNPSAVLKAMTPAFLRHDEQGSKFAHALSASATKPSFMAVTL